MEKLSLSSSSESVEKPETETNEKRRSDSTTAKPKKEGTFQTPEKVVAPKEQTPVKAKRLQKHLQRRGSLQRTGSQAPREQKPDNGPKPGPAADELFQKPDNGIKPSPSAHEPIHRRKSQGISRSSSSSSDDRVQTRRFRRPSDSGSTDNLSLRGHKSSSSCISSIGRIGIRRSKRLSESSSTDNAPRREEGTVSVFRQKPSSKRQTPCQERMKPEKPDKPERSVKTFHSPATSGDDDSDSVQSLGGVSNLSSD